MNVNRFNFLILQNYQFINEINSKFPDISLQTYETEDKGKLWISIGFSTFYVCVSVSLIFT